MYRASVITAIGKPENYSRFYDRYFKNISELSIFEEIEFVIVPMKWDKKFDEWSKLKNFKFVEDDGKGMYSAWNAGIKAATAPYVTNWNIDDVRFSESLENKCDFLDENKDIDLVYNYYTVSSDIEEDFNNFDLSKSRKVNTYPDNAHEYVYNCCMCGPDPLWRKSVHDDIGYFDYNNYPSIADWEMWIRMAENGSKFKLIPEVYTLLFDFPDRISHTVGGEKRDNIEKPRLYKQYEKGFKNPKPLEITETEIGKDGVVLSILILTMNRRKHYLERLQEVLLPQVNDKVEVLYSIDDGERSTGEKRNELLAKASGEYVAFVDDDDLVSEDYVDLILKAAETKPDAIGIHLLHFVDSVLKGLTYHSLKYTTWWDEPNKENPELTNYYRNPNHINPIRTEHALKVGFPHIDRGEDKWFSERVLQHLKTCVDIEQPIYKYLVRRNKEC